MHISVKIGRMARVSWSIFARRLKWWVLSFPLLFTFSSFMLKFTDVLLQLVCLCVCVYSLNVNEIWNADLLKRIKIFLVWFKQLWSKKGTVDTNVLTSLRSLLIIKLLILRPLVMSIFRVTERSWAQQRWLYLHVVLCSMYGILTTFSISSFMHRLALYSTVIGLYFPRYQ
jgi:hypothetical protein